MTQPINNNETPKTPDTPKELKDAVVAVLDEKGAKDIVVLDMTEKSSIADYFVVATGKNVSNVRALSEHLEEKLEEQGVFAARKEGLTDARWVVVDYNSVIVHIFNGDTRDFYSLETLWK